MRVYVKDSTERLAVLDIDRFAGNQIFCPSGKGNGHDRIWYHIKV